MRHGKCQEMNTREHIDHYACMMFHVRNVQGNVFLSVLGYTGIVFLYYCTNPALDVSVRGATRCQGGGLRRMEMMGLG